MSTQSPFPYPDEAVLVFTRGGHRGLAVRVSKSYSFWSTDHWEIVLVLHAPGTPMDGAHFIRESAEMVAQYCSYAKEGT